MKECAFNGARALQALSDLGESGLAGEGVASPCAAAQPRPPPPTQLALTPGIVFECLVLFPA